MPADPPNVPRRDDLLRITEIFYSIQGESRPVGFPTVFVRLTGCPLRCRWCDTGYAFHGGTRRSQDDVLAEVANYGAGSYVCVTGGEPLAQPACRPLLEALCDAGYHVSLETSGALDIAGIDPRVSVVLDLKAPGSGEEGRNHLANLDRLRPEDQLKFVIGDRADFDWACAMIATHELASRCELLVSPVYGELPARELAEWVLQARLPVRFQVQLHKLLWGDERGR